MKDKTDLYSDLIDRPVVVRSSPSGVWMGTLEVADGNTVRLRNARRAWNWQGAASCSGLASHGPISGKITAPVETAIILEVCEVLALSTAAIDRWAAVSPWIA